jgi:hypothetical protein
MGLYAKRNGTNKRNSKTGEVKLVPSTSRELRLTELEQLNIELMDSLEACLFAIKDFCERNNIPFYDEKMLATIKKINCLINEISPMPYMALNKRKVTDPYYEEENNRRGNSTLNHKT